MCVCMSVVCFESACACLVRAHASSGCVCVYVCACMYVCACAHQSVSFCVNNCVCESLFLIVYEM
jgi:hypothetical protein